MFHGAIEQLKVVRFYGPQYRG